jgi:hypothetical protein
MRFDYVRQIICATEVVLLIKLGRNEVKPNEIKLALKLKDDYFKSKKKWKNI